MNNVWGIWVYTHTVVVWKDRLSLKSSDCYYKPQVLQKRQELIHSVYTYFHHIIPYHVLFVVDKCAILAIDSHLRI